MESLSSGASTCWEVSWIRMCFRVHMFAFSYVCMHIYICAFFCSECCVRFNKGVLGNSAHAGVNVTKVFLDTNVHLCEHTRCRVCTCVYMHLNMCICMHMYMDAYVRLWCCLKRWCIVGEIFYLCTGVHIHAYVYVCACMYACICTYVYVCIRMYVCLYICMYTHTCGCTYALV